jgi:outer membrane protein assembly factor BamB
VGGRVRGFLGAGLAVSAALILPAVASSAADWATYGSSISRSGFNSSEKTLTTRNVRSLKQRWSAPVGGLIDTQPVVASGVQVGRRRTRTDIVYVGNESGRFEAVNAANGHVIWRRNLGAVHASCADLPSYGVTGTPQIDRRRHSVFVVSKGKASELDLATGRTKHKWVITGVPQREHNWSALTLSHGILYVALAGICDQEPYRGRIVATNVRTRKRVANWQVTRTGGRFGGGIWSFGGVSADARGNIYTATGDSSGANQHLGYAEHVVRLTPHLHVHSSDYPGVKGQDADFGATPVLYRAPGCPPQLAVGNKHGLFFVYDRGRIGHGPVQKIHLGGSKDGGRALLGTAAYWPQGRMLYVSNPLRHGRYVPGIVAFRVTGHCRLARAWNARGPKKLTSSPTVANGVVYYGTGRSSKVVALDARTGKHLKALSVHGAIFNAPSVLGGIVYAGSWHGRLYAFGIPKHR